MAREVASPLAVHWITEADGQDNLASAMDEAEQAVRRAVSAEALSGPTDLAITLTGDDEIRQLNASYRGLDEVTDVLSFSLSEGEASFVAPPDGVRHLGDVIISLPQAQRQAPEFSRSWQQELALLAVHGALHLLGYDHAQEDEARAMQAREQAALSS